MAKTAALELLGSQKLIERKIWIIENSTLCCDMVGFYEVNKNIVFLSHFSWLFQHVVSKLHMLEVSKIMLKTWVLFMTTDVQLQVAKQDFQAMLNIKIMQLSMVIWALNVDGVMKSLKLWVSQYSVAFLNKSFLKSFLAIT